MLRSFAKDLFYPLECNFAKLPAEIIGRFKEDTSPRKVVFCLIDAFGQDQLERHRKQGSSLDDLCKKCTYEPLTSQFPSTTTAHVTTAFFNLPVGQHGMYEWQIYEPLCDGIFITLPYTNVSGGALPDVEKLLPYKNVFEDLSDYGVTSIIVSPEEYRSSPYNRIAARGARYVGYSSCSWEQTLASAIAAMPERSYLYFYFPYIDEAGHNFGPESEEVSTRVSRLFTGLAKVLNEAHGCEWLLTADHGMVSVDPKLTVRLDLECPWLLPLIRRNRQGRPMAPAGSERDLFIHTMDPSTVCEKLRAHLGDRAEVRTAEEMIQLGFFGDSVSQRLRERLGEVVVLPIEGESVWMMEELSRLGQHGGLTKKEIQTFLLRSV